jgi:excisionase family DNA binding protein
MEQTSDVLKSKEAAQFLRADYCTLMRKAKNGEVPSFRIGGKVLFRRSTLEAWMDEQERKSVKE